MVVRGRKVQVWVYFPHSDGTFSFLILLTRPDRGEFWQPVTGSVEAGESLEDGARREAEEETGLTFENEPPPKPLGIPFEFEKRGKPVIEYGFSLRAPSSDKGRNPPPIHIDSHEHIESRWVSSEEALKKIHYPSNRQMLQLLLEELRTPASG